MTCSPGTPPRTRPGGIRAEGTQVIYGALRAMSVIERARHRSASCAPPARYPRADYRPLPTWPAARSATCSWTTSASASRRWTTPPSSSSATSLGKLFWADIEQPPPRHLQPSHLPDDVARAWKQRLAGQGRLRRAPPRRSTERTSTRQLPDHRPRLLPRHGPVGPRTTRPAGRRGQCPARSAPQEITSRKNAQHRKSRMDARTRERLPVLPSPGRAPSTASGRTPPPSSRRPARPSRARSSPPPAQTLIRLPVTKRVPAQGLGLRPRHRRAPPT